MSHSAGWVRAGALGLGLALALGGAAYAGPGFGESRTIDGRGNNRRHPERGAAGQPLIRLSPVGYADGGSAPARPGAASARAVSNALCQQVGKVPNRLRASDFVWQWGQFLDHDLDLTEGADPPEPFDIAVPLGDPFFDPFGTGTQVIGLSRSVYGVDASGVRQQLNQITAWIDASNVYGSDPVRAAALRTLDGTGRLRTSAGGLLPFNTAGLPNAGGPSPSLFLAGDVRANEQVGLTSLHTLFVREHNFWAGVFRCVPWLSGDEVYEAARAIVGAEVQAITYREFLPVLLGRSALSRYRGYDASVDPQISNEFSTAAYRVGHTMLSPHLLRLDARGDEIAEGHLALRDAFFAPHRITDEGGIDPILRGLASQKAQNVDCAVVEDVRSFLFGPPGSGGFDLASLNIQRGRDHGLPGYNDVRQAFGLAPAAGFDDVSTDPVLQAGLASVYASPWEMDPWPGLLAEDSEPGSMVGEALRVILADQFERLRDGDRFYYERSLPRAWVRLVEEQTLSRIIRRNTAIGRELQDDAFHVPRRKGPRDLARGRDHDRGHGRR